MAKNFNVGDKVVCNYRGGNRHIGKVVNITPKRGDVVVDCGNYKETYGSDGFSKGGDIWNRSYIELLTPEIEEDIRKTNLIWKCRRTFDEQKTHLTANQAEKILAILNEEDITE